MDKKDEKLIEELMEPVRKLMEDELPERLAMIVYEAFKKGVEYADRKKDVK